MNDETETIADDPNFTNAVATVTVCEVQLDKLRDGLRDQDDEDSPAFRAAEAANKAAWDALASYVDCRTARRVCEALQAQEKAQQKQAQEKARAEGGKGE